MDIVEVGEMIRTVLFLPFWASGESIQDQSVLFETV